MSRLGRRRFVQSVLRLGLFGAGLAPLTGCRERSSHARSPAAIPRIGVLLAGSEAGSAPVIGTFRHGLGEQGHTQGQTIAIEWRFADGRVQRFRDLAAELVGLNVDVLVVDGAPAAGAAKNATSVIPIVAVLPLLANPVAFGLVSSMARPGGNLTGFTGEAGGSSELWGKRLALLKEIVPGASRLAILWDAAQSGPFPWDAPWVPELSLHVHIQALEVRTPGDFAGAFEAAVSGAADILAVTGSVLINTNLKRVADLALSSRLPAISSARAFAAAGGLMVYAADQLDLWRRAASYVDKILKGAKPADLPVEQPTMFDFVVNLKTAQALGLTFPPSALAQATEVIR